MCTDNKHEETTHIDNSAPKRTLSQEDLNDLVYSFTSDGDDTSEDTEGVASKEKKERKCGDSQV